MKLQILIDVPPPVEKAKEAPCPMGIEDKVRDALELIESGHESHQEWIMINKLYKALCEKKPNKRINNLKKMIEPVLAKYGLHGVSNEG